MTTKAYTEPLEFADRREWRDWLASHHHLESEAVLVIHKKDFEDHGLGYEAATEEALCFGWIDGLLRSLDERRYLLRYTPRRRDSIWSITNIERVDRLIREGRMTEAGLEKIAEGKETGQWEAAIRREQVDIIPSQLEEELKRIDGGVEAYHAVPDSRKKQFIYWLQTAKREDTKQRRIEKIVAEVTGSGTA
ncbi:MAG: YdeI/OmpD-associated family protein [Anaerolineae bacterium]|jgi:uncharacterized protein YdeI (YjbR/CyaY-like superfamily)